MNNRNAGVRPNCGTLVGDLILGIAAAFGYSDDEVGGAVDPIARRLELAYYRVGHALGYVDDDTYAEIEADLGL